MQESEIIELFYRELKPETDATGDYSSRLDDCALLPAATFSKRDDNRVLVTTDSLIENTHFRRDWSGAVDLALKLFHCNLSDLSCSGGEPSFALLNLGLPHNIEADFIRQFAATLKSELASYNCDLIGGDTFHSEIMVLSLTMGGPARRHLKRSGGRSGDSIYLTGGVGLSLLGYKLLRGSITLPESEQELRQAALAKHLQPRARTAWCRKIVDTKEIRAAMDLSDGLIQDSKRLALASGLSLRIDLEKIPIYPGVERYLTAEQAAQSGEELEILMLGEPGLNFDFPCSEIGEASLAERSTVEFYKDGKLCSLSQEGFLHFQDGK